MTTYPFRRINMKTIPELEQYNPIPKGEAIIIREIPNEVYHSDVGISSSFVRKFADSQVHAVESQEQETTPSDELRYCRSLHVSRRRGRL